MAGLGYGKKSRYLESDQEEHMISHSLDNDYEGGYWENGEFFFERERPRHVMSKEEQIYGIFGDEDAYERERDKWRTPGGRSLLGQTMRFVSSGVLKPGEEEEEKERKEEKKAPEAASTPAPQQQQQQQQQRSRPTFRGKHSGVMTGERRQFGDKEEEGERKEANKSAAAKKPAAPPPKFDKDFAAFEKYEKGFGLKMLLKMGFKGRLGKHEQGIANPIQVKIRPKNMGMGFGNFKEVDRNEEERKRKERERGAAAQQEEGEGEEEREPAWRRDAPKRKRRVYKTAAELIAEQEGGKPGAAPAGPQIVLDMRGPQAKVTSLDKVTSLGQEWAPSKQARTALPELQHNIKLLVDLTEADIHRYSRELKHASERFVTLERERDELEGILQREEAAIERHEQLIKLIEDTQDKLNQLAASALRGKPSLTAGHAAVVEYEMASAFERLDMVADVLDTIQHRFQHEYTTHKLASLAVAFAFPIFKSLMQGWEPLVMRAKPLPGTEAAVDRHKRVLATLTRYRLLLSGESDGLGDVWIRLLHEFVVPKLRFVFTTAWQPRDYEPAVALLDGIRSVLPEDIYGNVLAQLIVPRLRHEVGIWNPRQDPVPIHLWIHPWLTILSEEALEPVCAQIRYKLSFILQQEWHWADGSARAIIEPWRNVWPDKEMQAFLAKSILPKLHWGLRNEFVVNPQQQVIAGLKEALAWTGLIPIPSMVTLLLAEFFPKWIHALYAWLSTGSADLEQVAKWYAGWKGLLPQPLLEAPAVKAMLAQGLSIMQAAMEGQPLGPAYQAAMQTLSQLANADAKALPAARQQQKQPAPSAKFATAAMEEEAEGVELTGASFKDAVQKLAELNNLEFSPNLKRGMHDGKQIYNFGKLSIYLHNQNLYAWLPSRAGDGTMEWRAISLREALERARG